MPKPESVVSILRRAAANPATMEKASQARALVAGWCNQLDRLPGADTLHRLAYRIELGETVEESAAAEYMYRWHLPLNQWVNHAETDKRGNRNRNRNPLGAWVAPHAIGM